MTEPDQHPLLSKACSKAAFIEVFPDDLRDHRAVKVCGQLAPESFRPEKIEILKLRRKSAVYRLTGVAADGTPVIAKRCLAATALVERVIHEDFLPRLPLLTLCCHGYVEEPDGKYCWLLLEDAGGTEYVPGAAEHRALAGRWLATIHAAAMKSGLAERLPNREPSHYLKLLQTSRETIREHVGNPALPGDDARMLEALATDCDALESNWGQVEKKCARAPRRIVHGDLAVKNVRVRSTADGSALMVFDWENAGWGVPGADLAQFTCRTISPDLETYASTLRKLAPGVDGSALRELAECGKFFRLIDAIRWDTGLLISQPHPVRSNHMSRLRVYQTRLHEMLRATNWAT